MMMSQRIHVFALLVLISAAPAMAQDYPSRPITLIVPYAAGGGNDLMARTAAENMPPTSIARRPNGLLS
jgi:tripartite-type tricarboxylate transporter receptor subunit TctC